MGLTVKKSLDGIITKSLTNYQQIDLTDAEKAKALSVLSREIKIFNDEKILILDSRIKNAKLKLERQKIEKEIELNDKKFELEQKKFLLDERKLDIEKQKIDIEYLKMSKEDKIREEDSKNLKKDKIINVGLKILEIGAPLAINTILVLMNFRLIYKDDGRVPSEMKDLIKNVYRGK